MCRHACRLVVVRVGTVMTLARAMLFPIWLARRPIARAVAAVMCAVAGRDRKERL